MLHTLYQCITGLFALADETPREAITRLRNNWNLRMLPWEQLHVLFLGQTFTYDSETLTKK